MLRHLLLSTTILAASTGYTAGFNLKTESGIALGQGYGGATAGNGYAESQYLNPANLRDLDGVQLQIGGNAISSRLNVEHSAGTTLLSTPVAGETNPGNSTSLKAAPNLFASWKINQLTTVGLGITVPWGLSTKNDEDWVGRYQAVTSEIKSVNLTPSIAYSLSDQLSFGAGLQAQYLEARLTNNVDCGTIDAANFGGALGLTPGTSASDCNADIEGDDWAFGFNVGLNYKTTFGTRLGLAYRSKIDHNIDGDVSYDLPNPALAAALPNGGISTDLETPAMLTAGITQKINNKLELGLDIHWTEWSSLEDVRIDFDSGQASITEHYNWHDTIFVGLGGNYIINNQWAVRSGIAYDQSPVKDSLRNPRLPGSDRYWFNIGTSYKFSDSFALHGTYTYGFMDSDNNVDLNNANGGLNAEYETPRFQVLSLQGTFKF